MKRFKYPRTPHLPWSNGATNDDKTLNDVKHFHHKQIIVTEKMDGENTTLYSDGYIHARSIDGRHHPSRDWIKSTWASKNNRPALDMGLLRKNYRILGENLYARHSISYNNLESFFYIFGVADETHMLHWNIVKAASKEFDLPIPRVLYEGEFDVAVLKKIAEKLDNNVEGYVVRLKNEFLIEDFEHSVAKYVRANHVQTDKHWMHSEIVKNVLKSN